ncbi:MAG TPA: HicB family protein [Lachnospiraceae bacterium]|nr:HicB family protein [Lachnospiraceae bacterium]HBY70697.1 HicB family protein [Lachnospiraceae bacterium]HCA70532.1 HicB family protein [Lachnospiraceae bacterium]HCM12407.1 HicB family protein [Lachnospiraceae bacterium]HCR39772.1 HicB family protein [Lachnospiraceae bacterium]
MMKLFYPAVFEKEEDGRYFVYFPDIEGCNTQGDTIDQAYEMAFDALGLVLSHYKDNNIEIPTPSEPKSIELSDNQVAVIVQFDMLEYQKKYESKAVKKTLTIPSWLNELAIEQNINFSQVLQDALMNKVNM